MRAHQIQAGQIIRLSNQLRAEVIDSEPHQYSKDDWVFRLKPINARNTTPYWYSVPRHSEVEVSPSLSVVR